MGKTIRGVGHVFGALAALGFLVPLCIATVYAIAVPQSDDVPWLMVQLIKAYGSSHAWVYAAIIDCLLWCIGKLIGDHSSDEPPNICDNCPFAP